MAASLGVRQYSGLLPPANPSAFWMACWISCTSVSSGEDRRELSSVMVLVSVLYVPYVPSGRSAKRRPARRSWG